MALTARSVRFRELEKGVKTLRAHLLPKALSNTGVYPLETHVRAAGFRVLSHAEFESFFEDRVWEVALASVQKFSKQGVVSKVLLALISFCGQKMDVPPDQLVPPTGADAAAWSEKLLVKTKVNVAMRSLKAVIDTNHGVRERNLLSLLLPVGVEVSQIDSAWLATIDSFGERRGTYAHRSFGAYRATQLPDPGTEITTADDILKGARTIDDALNKLLP